MLLENENKNESVLGLAREGDNFTLTLTSPCGYEYSLAALVKNDDTGAYCLSRIGGFLPSRIKEIGSDKLEIDSEGCVRNFREYKINGRLREVKAQLSQLLMSLGYLPHIGSPRSPFSLDLHVNELESQLKDVLRKLDEMIK